VAGLAAGTYVVVHRLTHPLLLSIILRVRFVDSQILAVNDGCPHRTGRRLVFLHDDMLYDGEGPASKAGGLAKPGLSCWARWAIATGLVIDRFAIRANACCPRRYSSMLLL